MKKLKIEMVLDLTCSWCPIGYKYITTALKNLDLTEEDVDFKFLPFQLNPEMSNDGELINNNLKRKTGQNDGQLELYRENLLNVAKECGVEFDFNKRTHYFNTFQGHILINLAQEKSLQQDVYEILCDAYYKNGKKFTDEGVINKVADKLELSKEYIFNLFSQSSIKKEFSKKESYVKLLGINSIPTFIINDTNLIRGSNSVEFFESYLQNL